MGKSDLAEIAHNITYLSTGPAGEALYKISKYNTATQNPRSYFSTRCSSFNLSPGKHAADAMQQLHHDVIENGSAVWGMVRRLKICATVTLYIYKELGRNSDRLTITLPSMFDLFNVRLSRKSFVEEDILNHLLSLPNSRTISK